MCPTYLTPENEKGGNAIQSTSSLKSKSGRASDGTFTHFESTCNPKISFFRVLTWDCRHLANAQILRRLEREAATQGWNLPKVCTPLELMGEWTYENDDESDP